MSPLLARLGGPSTGMGTPVSRLRIYNFGVSQPHVQCVLFKADGEFQCLFACVLPPLEVVVQGVVALSSIPQGLAVSCVLRWCRWYRFWAVANVGFPAMPGRYRCMRVMEEKLQTRSESTSNVYWSRS